MCYESVVKTLRGSALFLLRCSNTHIKSTCKVFLRPPWTSCLNVSGMWLRLWVARVTQQPLISEVKSLSLMSQGSCFGRPPSNTSLHSTGLASSPAGPAHFSLSPSLFWGPSESWKMACSWPSTSFPSRGSTVRSVDRDPHTSINMSSTALAQVTLLHH